jgi:monoamine oxidase
VSAPLSRRAFLQQAGLAALSLPFLPYRTRQPHAVVIGAGLSGLAAAHALRQAGWEVTVLDARDRVGGRVLSYRFGQAPDLVCELGAEWIGLNHERMQALCHDFGLELKEHRFQYWLMQNGQVSGPEGWGFSPEAEAAFERLREDFEGYDEEDHRRMDQTDWWTLLQRRGFSDDDLRLRDLMDSTDFGESIRHVSAYSAAAEYFESSPDNEMDFKVIGGNSRLIDALADRVGRGAFHLGGLVTAIRQRGGRVEVEAGGQTFAGDACVCTVPARMLPDITFDPPLPEAQLEAAKALQYARIVKNQVLFADRFWEADPFSLVSDVTSHFYFHSTHGQPGEQGILCSYAVGEKADVLAAQDDARRQAIIAGELAPLDPRAPELARGIASYPWQRDRYTRGAYALYRPGQWFTVRPALAEPHGKVLFAGEHLADWQGFMEGAVNTGEEAAEMLLD